LRRPAAVTANHARTSREIKQVKLTYAQAAYKEGWAMKMTDISLVVGEGAAPSRHANQAFPGAYKSLCEDSVPQRFKQRIESWDI
jgi:hypothetical protein